LGRPIIAQPGSSPGPAPAKRVPPAFRFPRAP
jgi:hypothetical protein